MVLNTGTRRCARPLTVAEPIIRKTYVDLSPVPELQYAHTRVLEHHLVVPEPDRERGVAVVFEELVGPLEEEGGYRRVVACLLQIGTTSVSIRKLQVQGTSRAAMSSLKADVALSLRIVAVSA